MPIRYYPAIIEKGESSYGVIFPDLSGCVSVGDSVEEALLNAEEALSLHLDSMARDGDAIPSPTALD
ncbi:MAG: hypothetical protein G8345_20455, partial [Magnetococcales bacterium]|nr:hypothetical protein [Magnetococcales bacterium]